MTLTSKNYKLITANLNVVVAYPQHIKQKPKCKSDRKDAKWLNRGRFRFIALPLKIRGGTGSPVRAVAVFE